MGLVLKEGCAFRISILSPFLATFFMACAYYYFQYTYSRMASADLSEWVLYAGEEVFYPSKERYTLFFYSSNLASHRKILENLSHDAGDGVPVVAVDFAQDRSFVPPEEVVSVTSGMNTLLKYVHRFRIVQLPVAIEVSKKRSTLYQQDSKSRVISLESLESNAQGDLGK